MKIICLMPTRRWWNWPVLRASYEAVPWGQIEFTWRPLVYAAEWNAVPDFVQRVMGAGWIQPLTVTPPAEDEKFSHITHKVNEGLADLEASGFDGWVYFGSDDQLLPRSAARWSEGRQYPMIVTSLRRGQSVAASGYETFDLHGAPENMRVYRVSGDQVLVRMDALRGRRWSRSRVADGLLVEELHRERPDDFYYLPDVFLPFNALEEGRWHGSKLKECLEA